MRRQLAAAQDQIQAMALIQSDDYLSKSEVAQFRTILYRDIRPPSMLLLHMGSQIIFPSPLLLSTCAALHRTLEPIWTA